MDLIAAMPEMVCHLVLGECSDILAAKPTMGVIGGWEPRIPGLRAKMGTFVPKPTAQQSLINLSALKDAVPMLPKSGRHGGGINDHLPLSIADCRNRSGAPWRETA